MERFTALLFGVALRTVFAHGQDPQSALIEERISGFAREVKQRLAFVDAASGCESYAWVDSTARALAAALTDERGSDHVPFSNYTTGIALAEYYKCSDPDLSTYYLSTAVTALMHTGQRPMPYYTLRDLADMAREADRARSAGRLERMHRKLLRRVDDLAVVMATH